MANQVLQRQIEDSYAKLTALQQEVNSVNTTPITNVVPLAPSVVDSSLGTKVQEVAPITTISDIENLINKLIEEKLVGVLGSVVPPEPVKEVTILDALGNILTVAELKWLQDAKVISRIPEFVLTEEGQELTQKFFRAYRKDYEK